MQGGLPQDRGRLRPSHGPRGSQQLSPTVPSPPEHPGCILEESGPFTNLSHPKSNIKILSEHAFRGVNEFHFDGCLCCQVLQYLVPVTQKSFCKTILTSLRMLEHTQEI